MTSRQLHGMPHYRNATEITSPCDSHHVVPWAYFHELLNTNTFSSVAFIQFLEQYLVPNRIWMKRNPHLTWMNLLALVGFLHHRQELKEELEMKNLIHDPEFMEIFFLHNSPL